MRMRAGRPRGMLGMDEVLVVRHRVLVEGASRREVARALGISRNTVRRYLSGAPVGVRKASPRERPVLEMARSRMDALLTESPQWTGGKQRLTARRLHRMLLAEGIHVGETLVKRYVRERRRRAAEVFVPLVYRPGDLGEVDFFEVLVDLGGGGQRRGCSSCARCTRAATSPGCSPDRTRRASWRDTFARSSTSAGCCTGLPTTTCELR